MENVLVVRHSAGFFSCATVRLRNIIDYYNKNKILPIVDSSSQWSFYYDEPKDVSTEFFKTTDDIFEYPEEVIFSSAIEEDQFSDYSKINYNKVTSFVKKYFSPSDKVVETISFITEKYNIDFDNTISVLYRGNDKAGETRIPSYENMVKKTSEVLEKNPNCRLLIQSDEQEFCDLMLSKFPNSIVIEETFKMTRATSAVQFVIPKGKRVEFAQNFLSVMLIIGKTKHLITNSGNVGMWACLFKGSYENVHQFLNGGFL